MRSVAEVDALLGELAVPVRSEAVPVRQAVGRTLAQPVVADRDGPPFPRVTMDGYALWSGDEGPWTVVTQQLAGQPAVDRPGVSTAVEVATGAVLPGRCDVVLPYEDTRRVGDVVTATTASPLVPLRYVHQRGADYLEGQTLLTEGTRLTSPHLHTLASVGLSRVEVRARADWALVSTGDELVEASTTPEAWQIRRSNTTALAGESASWGLTPHHHASLRDQHGELLTGLGNLLAEVDVLVITGGVSAGVLDLVPSVLKELGVDELFHGVRQRPGRPLWCGRLTRHGRRSTLVFGLPGNPVSSLVLFRRYVLPWLLRCEGRHLPAATVASDDVPHELRPAEGHTVFLPWSPAGMLPWKGSGDFHALAASTGFVELGAQTPTSALPFFAWGGLP